MKNLETNKYRLAYLIKYTATAFFYPFFALFLSTVSGKSIREISTILMLLPLTSVLVNPIWNYLAKNVNYHKIFMIVFAIVESILLFSLLYFASYFAIIIIVILMSVVREPFFAMIEGYTTVYTMREKQNYSTIRMFGTVGYALGVLISGFLIEYTGYNPILIITSILLLLVATTLFFIKPIKVEESDENKKGSFKELFKNKDFVLFFVFYVIILGGLFGGENFWGLYFKYRGYSEKTFGWVSFVSYGAEVVLLMLFAKFGSKFKIKHIMISVALMSVVRYLIFALNLPFYMLVANSVVRAYVMSAYLYIIVRYLSKYVKQHNITLALMIVETAKNILSAIIIGVAGPVIDKFSYSIFFYGLSILSILALFFIKYREDSNEYDIMLQENDLW